MITNLAQYQSKYSSFIKSKQVKNLNNEDPNSTFLMGMKGFAGDKSNKKIQTSFKQKINKEDKDNNIIDFIDYLRKKNQHCKQII